MPKNIRHYALKTLALFDYFGFEQLKKENVNVSKLIELRCRAIQRKKEEMAQLQNDIDRMQVEVIEGLLNYNSEKELEEKIAKIVINY
jgi:hypothetical protein